MRSMSSTTNFVLAVDALAVVATGPSRLKAFAVLLDAHGVLAAAAFSLYFYSH